ncbi:hypothetical protein J1N35_015137, partial [Gossypium stocksii]
MRLRALVNILQNHFIRKRFEGLRSHYPVRPDAENCAYYMKTGLCKFGSNCKFNHPVRRKSQ